MAKNFSKALRLLFHFFGGAYGGIIGIGALFLIFQIISNIAISHVFGMIFFITVQALASLLSIHFIFYDSVAHDKELSSDGELVLMAFGVTIGMTVFVGSAFGFATYHWNQVFPGIFGGVVDAMDIILFVLDIIAKSFLSDVMEHFNWSISQVQMNFSHFFYVCYAFLFRLHISLIFFASAIKLALHYLALKDRTRS